MRKCHRCQSEMIEGLNIKVHHAGWTIIISKGTGLFAERVAQPKVAICPKCGEISFYVDTEEIVS
ncbi:MAG: nucleic acid-binding protein [Bacillota bacterium]